MTTATLQTPHTHNVRQVSPGAVLAVLSLAAFMASLDLFIVNVAFPDISRDFHGESLSNLSWVLNGYTVLYAALLVPLGRLADRYRALCGDLPSLGGFEAVLDAEQLEIPDVFYPQSRDNPCVDDMRDERPRRIGIPRIGAPTRKQSLERLVTARTLPRGRLQALCSSGRRIRVLKTVSRRKLRWDQRFESAFLQR